MTLGTDIESAFAGERVQGIRDKVQEVLAGIESGEFRVAEKTDGRWRTNDWVKKALILAFKHFPTKIDDDGVSA